jgi:hypothetical protein
MSQEEIKSLQQMLTEMKGQMEQLQWQLDNKEDEPQRKKGFSKKVEVIADPGQYMGEKAKFAEWWAKVQIWIKANLEAFDSDIEIAAAIWSRMKGPTAGRYAETRLVGCMESQQWPKWPELKNEVEEYFRPQTERDWARHQLASFKQGQSRVDEFATRWLALYRQAGISDDHGVYLLEANTSPEIIKQIYLNGQRQTEVSSLMLLIRNVGRAQELFKLQHGNKSGWKSEFGNRNGQARTYGGQGEPMNIGAAGKPKCFNCGQEGHVKRFCKNKTVKCDTCYWTGGGHHDKCAKKGKEVRQVAEIKETKKSAVAEMDEEERKAFYFDMYETEMKSQGKAWSS